MFSMKVCIFHVKGNTIIELVSAFPFLSSIDLTVLDRSPREQLLNWHFVVHHLTEFIYLGKNVSWNVQVDRIKMMAKVNLIRNGYKR